MTVRQRFSILFVWALMVWVLASSADARQAGAEEEGAASFASVAEEFKRVAKTAFAEERWSDAVATYGRLVGHLLDGGYAEESASVASSRLRIAVAFKNSGNFPAARTILLHLAESAPEYEPERRRKLLAEVRAAQGLPASPASSPPVEAPRIQGPIRVEGDVTRPEVVSRYDPEYTRLARRARIQGVVIVEVIIDVAGSVSVVKVLKPLPMGLDRMAVAAVEKWRFRPATLDGKPIAVYYNLTVNFRLP